MSLLRLIFAGLVHHWRMHLAVALGVAVATAVLSGALLVGDSMRASLRALVMDRLGRVDEVLVTERFFRQQLAAELEDTPGFGQNFSRAWPAILLRGSFEHQAEPQVTWRAGQVNILGCGAWYWELGTGPRPHALPRMNEVVLNRPLADRLRTKLGDEVLVRLAAPGAIPAESSLGRKSDSVRSRRLKVISIVPAEGLARFDLRSSQIAPLNAFVSTETLQSVLGRRGQVNAIFVAGKSLDSAAPAEASRALERSIRPMLEDYGLLVERVLRSYQGETVIDYFNVTSDQMLLPPHVVETVMGSKKRSRVAEQPGYTYLANYIMTADGAARIPYSTITGIDSTPELGPLVHDAQGHPMGPLADDEIVLNGWAARDLEAQGAQLKPGDLIRITYFEPESVHGTVKENSTTFRLKAIAPLAQPRERPELTNDANLTPQVPGVTDQESMDNWDPPFPYDHRRVRSVPPNSQDEDYWRDYRTTPKAFVSLATAQRLWASRFGSATSLRIAPREGLTAEVLAETIRQQIDPAQLGFAFRPLKRHGLEAATGTTPFQWLFLSFSMFLIASSVMLIALLFRLGVERRAAEIGTMLAVGHAQRRVRWWLCVEGGLVAAVGGVVGLVAGAGFAWAMLTALESPRWWLAAIGTPFLRLAVRPQSLVIGYLVGVAMASLVILWTAKGLARLAVTELLGGRVQPPQGDPRAHWAIGRWIAVAVFVLAILAGLAGFALQGEAQAGAFFGSGALVLTMALLLVKSRLRNDATRPLVAAGDWALTRLAARSGSRHPGRSALTIGLVASATYLIVAVSAFRLDPSERGTGEFELIAESDLPIIHDLNAQSGREELGFSADQSRQFEESQIVSLRVQGGDDASCRNLYQAQQPRVLGVPKAMIARGGFDWASSAAETPEEHANPWLLLEKSLDEADGAVPVVLDKNTATYSLHLREGVGARIELNDGRGGKAPLRVVGLLASSIFQGDLLIAESAFVRLFPQGSGYQFFLIDAPAARVDETAGILEEQLGDFGFDAQPAGERLQAFLDVQNTYLSTFQSLGGLGLLLGTLGLAAVQWRSALERRGELALLRACGFPRARLAGLVTLENVLLLVVGLAVGVLAALVATLPHLVAGGASIPWRPLAGMLALVLIVGVAAGMMATRAALRAPLVVALRRD